MGLPLVTFPLVSRRLPSSVPRLISSLVLLLAIVDVAAITPLAIASEKSVMEVVETDLLLLMFRWLLFRLEFRFSHIFFFAHAGSFAYSSDVKVLKGSETSTPFINLGRSSVLLYGVIELCQGRPIPRPLPLPV